MNVLYLGKDKPHATERYVRSALEQHGLTVDLINVKPGVYERVKPLLSQDDLKFVLFSKPYVSGCQDFLELCKRKNIPTVCWQWDLYWGLRGTKPPQFNADYLFTTDGGHQHLWERHYSHHQVLRQGIHSLHHAAVPSDYKYDVAFVGSVMRTHPIRKALIKHLRNRYGSRFLLVQNTRGMKLNHLLSQIKIVVGDSHPSPYYWSNRIYEILGRGGFLMHPRVEGLDQEFTPGEHYVAYPRDDFDILDRTIEYYLSHDDERHKIKKSGFDHVGRHYTYTKRVQSLLLRIGQFRSAG